jgi:hypothetical protein
MRQSEQQAAHGNFVGDRAAASADDSAAERQNGSSAARAAQLAHVAAKPTVITLTILVFK